MLTFVWWVIASWSSARRTLSAIATSRSPTLCRKRSEVCSQTSTKTQTRHVRRF
ncbi:hypothetical protein PF010_g32503 [Phytophthora fragariae]|uniref:RxLR effector protein n=1 Tax=Phytophthora fragariae TaxID=53985 RepID=A0A6A3GAM2_9STRA|nr:hypothetical protein PF011_g32297 [Phytophthora fragariae]KAE9054514.1 hypothetical protein PF010_g32503 [Phytophthora fragariae]